MSGRTFSTAALVAASCLAASALCSGAVARPVAAAASAPPVRLAWKQGDVTVAVERIGDGARAVPATAPLRTPLGSVWKLFVYGYLVDRNADEPAYRCEATQRLPDDDYCCDPGASVSRDEALARSCGPYFDPARLRLGAADWSSYWADHDAPPWLRRLGALRPDTELPVADLLLALDRMPAPARLAARRALLAVSVREEGVLAALGSGPRFKTWSWRVDGERAGGAAGWLAEATPFWFEGPGTSRSVLRTQAAWLGARLGEHGLADAPADAASRSGEPCVEVDFFRRYPIASVRRGDGSAAPVGALAGRHAVRFANGSQLPIDAEPALQLSLDDGVPVIRARLPLEDYVARVVDREGQGREVAAARALAVAARSYLLQNAAEGEGCRRIADDSRTQRVSPNAPSEAARAAAAFTRELVLTGVPVRYHRDQAGPSVMSWQAAVADGRRGSDFVAILRTAYPGGTLAGIPSGSECDPMPQADAWLRARQARWRPLLRGEAGYEAPGEPVRVCQLGFGTPHSDQRRLLIRVREWQSREGRVTLIHEYLHLAFRGHPHGQDEGYVERLAQRLADL